MRRYKSNLFSFIRNVRYATVPNTSTSFVYKHKKEKIMKKDNVASTSDTGSDSDYESPVRKAFWEDPYLTSLETTVKSVSGDKVVFDETIGYSKSGGQDSDKITINDDIKVIASRWDKYTHLISYTLPENHGLKEGDKVKMEIDWPRRNRLMRLHFACELVLVLMNRHFCATKEGVELKPEEIDTKIFKTGAEMTEERAYVNFQYSSNIRSMIDIILPKFLKIIDSDLKIETGYLDKEDEERYWRVKGIATVPCGGTHVRSTKEVGHVTLTRRNGGKYKGKKCEKIYIKLKDNKPSSMPTLLKEKNKELSENETKEVASSQSKLTPSS